jgi:predicted Fe-S protein YdhL (DUF1289 family)
MISTEFCEKCLREQEFNESLQWQQYLEEKDHAIIESLSMNRKNIFLKLVK